KYSAALWRLMAWNRSSYVNRLRLSEWRRLLAQVALKEVELIKHQDRALLQQNRRHAYLSQYSDDDLLTYRFDGVFEKERRDDAQPSSPVPGAAKVATAPANRKPADAVSRTTTSACGAATRVTARASASGTGSSTSANSRIRRPRGYHALNTASLAQNTA